MGLFDKLKNVFLEDDEDFDNDIPAVKEKVTKSEPIIKEEPKEEIKKEPEPVIKKIEDEKVKEKKLSDTNENFKFPIIFEDEDFKEEKKKPKSINVLERENNNSVVNTNSSKYDVEKIMPSKPQKFKPSPVISPVYGVLDKNYTKEEIKTKDGLLSDSGADIDSVMKKAYGETKVEEPKKEEVTINITVKDDDVDKKIEEIKNTVEESIDEDIQDSIEALDERIKSIDDLINDTSDEDFYSLVDSMYNSDEGDE